MPFVRYVSESGGFRPPPPPPNLIRPCRNPGAWARLWWLLFVLISGSSLFIGCCSAWSCESRTVDARQREESVAIRRLTGSSSSQCCCPTQCHACSTSSITTTTFTSPMSATATTSYTVLAVIGNSEIHGEEGMSWVCHCVTGNGMGFVRAYKIAIFWTSRYVMLRVSDAQTQK